MPFFLVRRELTSASLEPQDLTRLLFLYQTFVETHEQIKKDAISDQQRRSPAGFQMQTLHDILLVPGSACRGEEVHPHAAVCARLDLLVTNMAAGAPAFCSVLAAVNR